MKNTLIKLLVLAGLLLGNNALADNLQPFTSATLADIRGEYAGKPYLLTLWSVDCAPCRVDLEKLSEVLQENPQLPIVLVATDPIEMRGEAGEILEDYGLESIVTWIFDEPFAEKLRFEIDPGWYGELPRSYFYDAAHQATGHSGVIPDNMLAEFINKR